MKLYRKHLMTEIYYWTYVGNIVSESESTNNTIELKSKKEAQKSAALNLLIALDIEESNI